MRTSFLILIILVSFLEVSAQEKMTEPVTLPRTFNYLNIDFAYSPKNFLPSSTPGETAWAGSFSWNYLYGLGKKRDFKIGFGLRFTTFKGKNQFHNSVKQMKVNPDSSDYLFMESFQSNFINAILAVQYTFFNRLDIGGNIDLIGFGIGGTQKGFYERTLKSESGAPSNFNLLLGGVNDKGNLNSKLFARYWITETFAAELGLHHVFTELTTYKKLYKDNNQFRHINNMISLGVSIFL